MRFMILTALLVFSSHALADATDKLEIGMSMAQVDDAIGGHQGSEVKDGVYRHFHNVTNPPLILTYSAKKKLTGWEIDRAEIARGEQAQAASDSYAEGHRRDQAAEKRTRIQAAGAYLANQPKPVHCASTRSGQTVSTDCN